ncbi:hypothetical protein RYX36_009815 [Vicia faba]
MSMQEHDFDRDLESVNTYTCTQIKKMQPDAEGKYRCTKSLDFPIKTFKEGRPLKFYIGFPVYCVRIAPHVMAIELSMLLGSPSFFWLCWLLYVLAGCDS